MKSKSEKKTKLIYLLCIIPFLTGCAPCPLQPSIFSGFEWLIIGFIIWLGMFLLKKNSSADPSKMQYLTEVLNIINQHLKILERRIEKLEEKENKKEK